jgi:hypothetical protein
MQTFLPYPSFVASAKSLDYRRLGKQRVEARQILKALRSGGGWQHHPAVRMWGGFEGALVLYGNLIIEEWMNRGYRNTMEICETGVVRMPPWLGDDVFHASHRSNLLRKDPNWYGQFGWTDRDDLPYVWPKIQEE